MKSESDQGDPAQTLLHDLAQPLNVIRLTSASIRNRISPQLSVDEAAYLESKLQRIERQVDRSVVMLDQLYGTGGKSQGS